MPTTSDLPGTLVTYSGTSFDLLNPSPDQVFLVDIAMALGRQCRFNGHTSRFYSVAEHSLQVASLLPEAARVYGLLHDAHEAYTGDIITPLKALLGPTIKSIERNIDLAIYESLLIRPPTEEEAAWVKDADQRMLFEEGARFLKGDWIAATKNHTHPGFSWLWPSEEPSVEAVTSAFHAALLTETPK